MCKCQNYYSHAVCCAEDRFHHAVFVLSPSTQPSTYLPLLRRQQTRVRDFEKKHALILHRHYDTHRTRVLYWSGTHRRTGARCRDFARGDTGSPLLGQSLPPHTYRTPTMTPLTRPGRGAHVGDTRTLFLSSVNNRTPVDFAQRNSSSRTRWRKTSLHIHTHTHVANTMRIRDNTSADYKELNNILVVLITFITEILKIKKKQINHNTPRGYRSSNVDCSVC